MNYPGNLIWLVPIIGALILWLSTIKPWNNKENDVVFYTIKIWITRILFSIIIIGGIVVALFGN